MELIVVIVVLSVLARIAYPQFIKAREQALDGQAQVILQAIRAAERNHFMQKGYYYPSSANVFSVSAISSNLSMDLVDDGQWTYRIWHSGGTNFNAELRRDKGNYSRYWYITKDSENATCHHVARNNWCPQ